MELDKKFNLAVVLSVVIFVMGGYFSAKYYFFTYPQVKWDSLEGIASELLRQFDLFTIQEVLLFVAMGVCITGLILTILFTSLHKQEISAREMASKHTSHVEDKQ